jgi:hypothetical protein
MYTDCSGDLKIRWSSFRDIRKPDNFRSGFRDIRKPDDFSSGFGIAIGIRKTDELA